MKLSCTDGSQSTGAQFRNHEIEPCGLSADAVGRYSSLGRGFPVSCAMYRMNGVLKLPPAMRILRVAAPPMGMERLSAFGSFLAASEAAPNADETTKCLRSMRWISAG